MVTQSYISIVSSCNLRGALSHVERHASYKVIWLCHKNVINCIMAVGQKKRRISLAYANCFLVYALHGLNLDQL